jgi:5-(carboxyamino)imidazole ribonucleotide mutase
MINQSNPIVAIIMGSASDLPVMQAAADILSEFKIAYEIDIISAHRTPEKMFDFATKAADRGIKAIIAGAGGAAHLPGMVASMTSLPVIGVPINSHNSIAGIDSLLSIVQMPGGIPVATVSINGAKNAGLLAIRMLGNHNQSLRQKIDTYRLSMKEKVIKDSSDITNK